MKSAIISLSVIAVILVGTAIGLGITFESYFGGDKLRNDEQDKKLMTIEQNDKSQQVLLNRHTGKIENAEVEIAKLHQANRAQDKRMDGIDEINKLQKQELERHAADIQKSKDDHEVSKATLERLSEENKRLNDRLIELTQRLTESTSKSEQEMRQLREDIEQIKRMLGLAPPAN